MTNERDVRSAIKRLEALGPRVWLRPGDHVVVSRSDGLYDHHGIVVPRNHMGLLQGRLTSLTRDGVPREGCRYAEEVPRGVQAGCRAGRSPR